MNKKQTVPNPDSHCLFSQENQTSNQLEALKALLRDEPEINNARVSYFKTEIELGKYQIQSKNIAQKMVLPVETVE
jgi:negative regulator of flagellin synthesis FlgM